MEKDVQNRIIWLKGKLINVNDAYINVLSPTAQFGLNVFEGIPCYWNNEQQQMFAFRLDDHYNRLIRSARLIEIDSKFSKKDLKKGLIDVIKANDYRENISVRQTLFVDGFGSWGSSETVEMFISPIPKGNMNLEYNKKGLHVSISTWRRISDNVLPPRIKCGANYMNSRLGHREAIRNGYDTCIFLNEFGKLSEGPGSCLFIVKDDKLITPPLTDSVLESITRETVITIARENGIHCDERSIDRTEIYTCDEAFLCGSAMEITPIYSVDRCHIGDVAGKITQFIQKQYYDATRGNDMKKIDWITPIY